MRKAGRTLAIFAAACTLAVSAASAAAGGVARVPAAAAAPSEGELVALDGFAAASLPRLQPEESVSALWPVAPGRRVSVVLTRHEIYAPDAVIVSVEGGREVPVPRSRLRFFWGTTGDDLDTRVLVVYDPDRGSTEATSWSGDNVYRLRREQSRGEKESYRLSRVEEPTPEAGVRPWSCGGEDESLRVAAPESPKPALGIRRPSEPELSANYAAILAIDTDNEFMLSRGDNNTTAVNYLANLVATMNSQTYNADFSPGKLTFVEGYTVLRPSTTPDPYVVVSSTGNADGSELNEFTSYWNANYGFVKRALTLMVSGKQPSPNSASGIAWLGSHTSPLLCNSSVGYSFNQVFTNVDDFSIIGRLVAHELGHNLGAAHTHCEGLDQCFSGEPGCYSGPTSCPSGGGTLMSYCHLLGGCSASAHFHPVQQVYINSNLQNAANAGVCVFPAITGVPSPVGVAPNSGGVSGGTASSVTGTNFQAGARVFVNGVLSTVTGYTPTQLDFLTPPGPTPTSVVNVMVTNPGPPSQSFTLTSAFTYTFDDVPVSNPFYAFVKKLYNDNITSGCGSGNYCVTSPVTRGQMSVFLLKSQGGASYTPPACSTPVFLDVPCSNGFAAWVNELAARNVTAGCGGGDYCLNDPVTRGQMAVFLLRTHDGSSYTPPACSTPPFADVPCSSPYAIWVQELVLRGITAGCGGGNYCLSNSVTRGQMAVFLVTTFTLP